MERIDKISNDINDDLSRAMRADTSREFDEVELFNERAKYFSKYDVKEDEFVNENAELICKICKTKRYFQCNDFVTVVRCECKQRELEEKERQERELRVRQEKMAKLKKLKELSLLGARYENATFDNLDMHRPKDFVDAVGRCKKYCENWDEIKKQGLGIYFYGDVGTGKSHLTACIGNYLLSRMVPVLFTNFLEIVKQIRKTYNDKSTTEASIISKLVDVDLLIIDDIGTERFVKNGEITDIQEKIYDLINARYVNCKPTIFSSNESLTQLVEDCGLMKKTVDRIASMSTAKIKLQGLSYRSIENKNKKALF